MSNSESREERKKRFKNLSSAERKMLIRKKLELQGLTEGSGVRGKDQSSYDKERLQTIADMLNQEQELMTGVKYEKFFILTPL